MTFNHYLSDVIGEDGKLTFEFDDRDLRFKHIVYCLDNEKEYEEKNGPYLSFYICQLDKIPSTMENMKIRSEMIFRTLLSEECITFDHLLIVLFVVSGNPLCIVNTKFKDGNLRVISNRSLLNTKYLLSRYRLPIHIQEL